MYEKQLNTCIYIWHRENRNHTACRTHRYKDVASILCEHLVALLMKLLVSVKFPHSYLFMDILVNVDFPGGTSGKEPTCQCRRHGRHRFDPWVGKIPWEKETATHCSILAWRIPWTEEPGGLQSMGLQRVGHDWSNLAHLCKHLYLSGKNLWSFETCQVTILLSAVNFTSSLLSLYPTLHAAPSPALVFSIGPCFEILGVRERGNKRGERCNGERKTNTWCSSVPPIYLASPFCCLSKL